MKSIFGIDSPLVRLLSKIADLLILNVIYLVSCIPIITIGAANAALYDVTTRLLKDEAMVWRHYWQAFRSNFKKATILWGIFLGIGAVLYGCAICYWSWDLPNRDVCLYLLGVVALVCIAVYSWIFPLQAHFENTIRNTINNGILCTFSYLPRTIIITFINLFFPIVVFIWPAILFNWIFLFLLLWFSASAYFNTLVLRKTMKRLDELADECE